MAGHASNWIKVGNVAGASSKGRVYISPIVLKRARLSKDDLKGLSAAEIMKIAKKSATPSGQAQKADPGPLLDKLPTGVKADAEKAAKGKTPGQVNEGFKKAVKQADSAKAAKKPGATKPGASFGLTDLLKGVGDLSAQGLAQIIAQLPPPTRRALVVAAGAATIAAVAAGVAPPVLALGVLAAAGSIANGKVVEPGKKAARKAVRRPAAKGGK